MHRQSLMELLRPITHDSLYCVIFNIFSLIERNFANDITSLLLVDLLHSEVAQIRCTNTGCLSASRDLIYAREVEAWAVLVRFTRDLIHDDTIGGWPLFGR